MAIIIGLVGAKGAGKTTTFNVLKNLLPTQEITLAGKLKDVSAQVTGIPREHFDSHQFKEKELDNPIFMTVDMVSKIFEAYGAKVTPEFYEKYVRPHVGTLLFSPRRVAQYVGTEVLRTWRPDVHCEEAYKGVQEKIGVVTDMRFPNEFDFFNINAAQYYPVYIQNFGAEMEAEKDMHESERHMKTLARRCIKTLPNNSSLKEFEASVQQFVQEAFNVK